MTQIVVVGSSNTDMVVRLPHIPAPGETVLGGDFVMTAGGKGANQAVAAARLGARVSIVARVGADLFGARALANLQKEGLNTQYVSQDQHAASGVALIFVDAAGENSIAVAPGANARLSPTDMAQARKVIQAADVLLLQLEVPLETTLAAARMAREAGTRVILNPAPAAGDLPLTDLLAHVDILTPNESEVGLLAGIRDRPQRAAHRLLEQGLETVIVTLGAQGALLIMPDGQRLVPGFSVAAVDTTAAGDAFSAGLAVALAEGQPLVEAVRFANACGALAATKLGAQPSLPTAKEVRAFLEQR